mgnify:CR=1 FL=1
MKRFFTIIASALLILSVASCDKDDSGFAPYYRVSTSFRWTGGTSGDADFSQISAVTDQFINIDFPSEERAVATYKDILSKTKDVSYSAPGDSYFKLSVAKYVSTQEDEHTIKYDIDPNYKSPVGHIWDAQGSRDL